MTFLQFLSPAIVNSDTVPTIYLMLRNLTPSLIIIMPVCNCEGGAAQYFYCNLVELRICTSVSLSAVNWNRPMTGVCFLAHTGVANRNGVSTRILYSFLNVACVNRGFFHYQISWIFLINQVPCVSSCWGGVVRRHTQVSATKGGNPLPAIIRVEWKARIFRSPLKERKLLC